MRQCDLVSMLAKALLSVLLSAIPWTVAHQAPLSMGSSRQEHWSGFPRPPPGDLPDAGIEPASLTPPALAGGFYTTGATWIVLYCSVAQSRLTHCHPMDCSMPGFPILPPLPELTQTHVCWAGDATQPSCPLSSPGKPPQVILSPTFSHSLKPHGRAPGAMILSQSQTPVWASGREFSSSAWVWVARVTHPESLTRIWAYALHVYSRHTQHWEERLMPSGICKVKPGSQLLHN